jgi:hypothetical protein
VWSAHADGIDTAVGLADQIALRTMAFKQLTETRATHGVCDVVLSDNSW